MTAKERALLEQLEPRILLSGTPAPESSDDQAVNVDVTPEETEKPQDIVNEIVFVDTNVKNYETLIDGLNRNVEVVLIGADEDGVERISNTLNGREDVSAIHIISHGDAGEVFLGNTKLTSDNLFAYHDTLKAWGESLSQDADILIYGCNVGQDSQFVADFAELTGADVAASDDITGAERLSGDHILEIKSGQVEALEVLDQEDYDVADARLAFGNTHVVTSDANSGAGSLRDIVASASAGDKIVFTSDMTISMLTNISIDKSLTIDAGGHDVVLDAQNNGRVFFASGSEGSPIDLTIIGVTMKNGTSVSASTSIGGRTYATNGYFGGGAIAAANVNLSLDEVTLENNEADRNGGAVYHYGGTLAINDSIFRNNKVSYYTDSEVAQARGGALSSRAEDSITISNSTFNNNQTYAYGDGQQSAIRGGGVYLSIDGDNTDVSVTGSEFSQNEVYAESTDNLSIVLGGGLYTYNWSSQVDVEISRNELSNNNVEAVSLSSSSYVLGGAFNINGTSTDSQILQGTIEYNTFSSNSITAYTDQGSTIYSASRVGTLTYNHNTVANNSASLSSTFSTEVIGVFGDGTQVFNGNLIAGNTSSNFISSLYVDSSTVSGTNNISQNTLNAKAGVDLSNLTVTQKTFAEINLQSLADNGGPTRTHAIVNTSASLDAGSASSPGDTDQRGYAITGTKDVGAFELNATAVDQSPVVSDWAVSLNEDAGVTALNIPAPTDDTGITSITVNGVPAASVGVFSKSDGTAVTNGMTLLVSELTGLRFTPAANWNGLVTLTYNVSDNVNPSVLGKVDVYVFPVNDDPSIASDIDGGAIGFVEDGLGNYSSVFNSSTGSAPIIISDLLDDPDGDTFNDYTLTITVNNGIITVDETDVDVTDNGTKTVVIKGTLDAIQAVIDTKVQYESDDDFNGPDPLTFTLRDNTENQQGSGGIKSDSISMTISVQAINDKPIINDLHGDAFTYTEGDGEVVIDKSDLSSITDIDSDDFNGGSLTISYVSGDTSDDQLAVKDSGVVDSGINVSGSTISYNGVEIGSIDGTLDGVDGEDLKIDLTSTSATKAAVAALIQAITFENTDTVDPAEGDRVLRFSLVDGDGTFGGGTDTGTADVTITVEGINSLPVAQASEVSLDRNTSYTFKVEDFNFSDDENNALQSITVSSLSLGTGGTLVHSGSTTVTNGMTITAAQIASLVYTPPSGEFGDNFANFEFTVNDAGSGTTKATMNIDVLQVNTAPIAVDDENSINELANSTDPSTVSGSSLIPGDIRANTTLGGTQGSDHWGQSGEMITTLTDGSYVVTWSDNHSDGSGWGIFAQRFNSSGEKLGTEFQVNTYIGGSQYLPAVGSLSNGGFVISWFGESGVNGRGVYAQIYDSNGDKVGTEFKASKLPSTAAYSNAVTGLDNGEFIVTWMDSNQSGDQYWGIFAQRFNSTGQKIGTEIHVNTFTNDQQYRPSISKLSDGGFVITWMSHGQDGSGWGIFAQRFNSSGEKLGTEFQVNTFVGSTQTEPSVSGLENGGFVITWQSNYQQGDSDYGIRAQRFDADGNKVGNELHVNTFTNYHQWRPSVSKLSDGGFVITWWSSSNPGGNGWDVYAQRYNSSGIKVGTEFRVNTYVYDSQLQPSVTYSQNGGFAVSWFSYGQPGGSNWDTYLKLFDANGNEGGDNGLLANDSDPDGDEISITLVKNFEDAEATPDGDGKITILGQYGSIEIIAATGEYTYTLDNTNADVNALDDSETLTETFTYTLSDGDKTDTAELNITINGVNDAPVTVGKVIDVNEDETIEFALDDFEFTDPEDQTYTFKLSDLDLNGGKLVYGADVEITGDITLDAAQIATLKYTPAKDENGDDYASFSFIVNDGKVDSNKSTITIDVTPVNDAPVAQNDSNEIDELAYSIDQNSVYGSSFISGEIEVKDYPTFDQLTHNHINGDNITGLPDGGYVITWSSDTQDGSGWGVYGQVYNADGSIRRSEFKINDTTLSHQDYSSITSLIDGGFVVTWSSEGQDGSGYGVYGQIHNADGSVRTSEFKINDTTLNNQFYSSITSLIDGGFVVTWSSEGQDGSGYGVYGQVHNADGSVRTSEFKINDTTFDDQNYSSLTGLIDGGFVVTWSSEGQDGSGWGVYGQIHNADGSVRTSEFKINDTTLNNQLFSSIAGLPDGSFVMTWSSLVQDGSGYGVYGQIHNADGSVRTGEFKISDTTFDDQNYSSITGLIDGGFVVTWSSQGQDGSGYGVYGQIHNADGSVRTGEFKMNDTVSDDQYLSSITSLSNGGFVIAWSSEGQAGLGFGVYKKTFDANGNESGDNGLLANDSDVEGDPFHINEVRNFDDDTATPVDDEITIDGEFGSIVINSLTGEYTYRLDNTNPFVHALNDGQTLVETFYYTLNDGEDTSEPAELNITINGVTDPLLAVDDDFTVTGTDEDTVLEIDALSNDLPDEAILLEYDSTSEEGASITVNSDGNFVYNPGSSEKLQALKPGESVIDTFEYKIGLEGEDGLESTATVSIKVDGLNDAPVFVSTTENTSFVGSSQPFDIRQPYATTTYAIAVQGTFPSRSLEADTSESLDLSAGSEPVLGSVLQFAGNFAPRGFMKAEGQLLQISQYSALFSILGTTYGGDGRTTFALPDLRGRVPVGTGQGAGLSNVTLGQKFGSESVTLNSTNMPSHNHELSNGDNTSSTGSSFSFNNRMPSLGLTPVIALQGTFPTRNASADIGSVHWFAGNFAPRGYALANGQLLPIVSNQALYSILGTTFGGDGRTTFALPDLRGRTPIHADSLNGIELGDKGGSEYITLTHDQIAAHSHGTSIGNTDPTGESAEIDLRSPYLALNYEIAQIGIFPSRNLDGNHEDHEDHDNEEVAGLYNGIENISLEQANAMVQELVEEGISRWVEAGISEEQAAALAAARYEIANLESGVLASVDDFNLVRIDADAIGRGWFIDASPEDDNEFDTVDSLTGELVATAGDALYKYDLLTTIMHEQGHLLGLAHAHDRSSVMSGMLQTGGRFNPLAEDIVEIEAPGHHGELFGVEPFIAQIGMFGGNFEVRGYEFTEGQLLQISSNSALFSLIGTIYGGDGRQTTGLPNFSGRAVMGAGNGPGLSSVNLGQMGGAESYELTVANLPSHFHTFTISNASLAAIDEDTGNPPGETVQNLFGPLFSDVDTDDTFSGIAISGDDSSDTEGYWQYSLDNGTSWINVGDVDTDSALLISVTDTMLRFLPAADYFGTPGVLKVHAVDSSFAGTWTSADARQSFNTESDDGTSPVSASPTDLTTSVNPINDAPVANADTGSSDNDDDAITVNVIDGDSNGGVADTDVDNDQADLLIFEDPSITSVTVGGVLLSGDDLTDFLDGHSLAVTNGGKSITFTPGDGLDTLPKDETAVIVIDYRVTDGELQDDETTDNSTLTLTITGSNENPTAQDKTITIDEDTSHVFSPSDFGFSDVDDGDTFASIVLDSIPAELTQQIGETGSVSGITDAYTTVNLQGVYDSPPLVFAFIQTYEGQDASVVRLRNIGTTSFELAISDEDGAHTNADTVSYIVLSEGEWTLPDGTELKVGTHTTSTNDDVFDTVTYASAFSEEPLVFSQVQTNNNSGLLLLKTRQEKTASPLESFDLNLEGEEGFDTGSVVPETIAYFAITPTSGQWGDVHVVGDQPSGTVSEQVTTVEINEFTPHHFFAAMATQNGNDSASTRGQGIDGNEISYFIEEDTLADSEIAHGSEELVSYLAFSGSGLLNAQLSSSEIPVDQISKLMYVPAPNENSNPNTALTFEVDFQVKDNNGGLSEEINTISFDVTPVNDAPVIESVVMPSEVDERSQLTFTITFSDVDHNREGDEYQIMIDWGSGPVQTFDLPYGTQEYSFTYNDDEPGSQDDIKDISILIHDRSFASDTYDTQVKINNVDPDAEAMDDEEVDEDVDFAIDVSGYFSDVADTDDPLTFSSANLPDGFSISTAGVISGKPTNAQAGGKLAEFVEYTITVKAEDGDGGSVEEDLKLTVNNINDKPVAIDLIASTDEDTSIEVDVVGTEAEPIATDIDDLLSVLSVSIVDEVIVSSDVSLPSDLSSFFSVSGQNIVFTPGDDFDALATGESAVIDVFYTLNDGNAENNISDTKKVTFTINGLNDQPTIDGEAVYETLDEEDADLQTLGSFDVEDLDESDILEYSVLSVELGTDSNDGGIDSSVLKGLMKVMPSSIGIGDGVTSGRLDWQFDAASGLFDYLAHNEHIELIYTLQVDDGEGHDADSDPHESSVATQTVTVMIYGTNDIPETISSTIYEAEDAVLGGSAAITSGNSGFTGSAYVDYQTDSSDFIEWTINVAEDGLYDFDFRYAFGRSGNRPLQVLVDNVEIDASLDFTGTGGWASWSNSSIEGVNLTAGEHTVKLQAIGFSGPNVDHLKVTSQEKNVDSYVTVNELDDAKSLRGSFTVEDVDVPDTVEFGIGGLSVSDSSTLGDYEVGDFEGLLTLLDTSDEIAAGETTGQIDWAFDAPAGMFDYLAYNEHIELIYTVTADDGHGFNDDAPHEDSLMERTVTIRINGTNDIPEADCPEVKVSYEAEDAVRSGAVAFANSSSGHSGTGYIDYRNDSGDALTWTVTVDSDGKYDLGFRYALNSSNRPLQVLVDGESVDDSLDFPPTGSWSEWAVSAVENVFLTEGEHEVTLLAIGDSGANIDRLDVISRSVNLDELDDAKTASGTITVEDVDLSDEPLFSIESVAVTVESNIGEFDADTDLLPLLQFNGNTDITSSTTSGEINWQFNAPAGMFDYLAHDEHLEMTYTILIDDENGFNGDDIHEDSQVRKTVTIRINGTNDQPSIVEEAASRTLDEGDGALQELGSFTVEDLDESDTPTYSVLSVGFGADSNKGSLSDEALKALMKVMPSSELIDGDETTGELDWQFDAAAGLFDYLAHDEHIELIYTLQVDDGNGFAADSAPDENSLATQTVTIRINGTNDQPIIIDENPGGGVYSAEGDQVGLAVGPEIDTITESTITVNEDFTVEDLNVQVDIDHTWVGDLQLILISPGGTEISLVNRLGVPESAFGDSTNNYTNTIFDDESEISIDTVDDIEGHEGTFYPEEPLNAVDGLSSQGDWTLKIIDNANGDGGLLNGWSLDFGVSSNQFQSFNEEDGPLTALGSFNVEDLDVSDIPSFSVDSVELGDGSNVGSHDNDDLLELMDIADTSDLIDGDETSGRLDWSFSAPAGMFDYLAHDEHIELIYTLQVDDNEGFGLEEDPDEPSITTQTVTIIINGTNDQPSITAVKDSHTFEEGNDDLSETGVLQVEDLDVSDLVTYSIDSMAVSPGSNTGALSNGQLEDMFDIDDSISVSGDSTDGSIVWNFNADAGTFDYLAHDEFIEMVYTVSANDGNSYSGDALHEDSIATKTVTIRINGNNDQPVAEPDYYHTDEDTSIRGNFITGNEEREEEGPQELQRRFFIGPQDFDLDASDNISMARVIVADLDFAGEEIFHEMDFREMSGNGSLTKVLSSGATLTVFKNGDFIYDPSTSEIFNGMQFPFMTDNILYTIMDDSLEGGSEGGLERPVLLDDIGGFESSLGLSEFLGSAGPYDEIAESDPVYAIFEVSAVNDAPEIVTPAAIVVDEDTSVVIKGIAISDVDADAEVLFDLGLELEGFFGDFIGGDEIRPLDVELPDEEIFAEPSIGLRASLSRLENGSFRLDFVKGQFDMPEEDISISLYLNESALIEILDLFGAPDELTENGYVEIPEFLVEGILGEFEEFEEDFPGFLNIIETNAQMRMTFDVGRGTININDRIENGIRPEQVSRNATGSVEVIASLREIQNTLDAGGLRYQGNLDFNGNDKLRIVLNDLGNYGAGGAKEVTAVIPIRVLSVLDLKKKPEAPEGANNSKGLSDQGVKLLEKVLVDAFRGNSLRFLSGGSDLQFDAEFLSQDALNVIAGMFDLNIELDNEVADTGNVEQEVKDKKVYDLSPLSKEDQNFIKDLLNLQEASDEEDDEEEKEVDDLSIMFDEVIIDQSILDGAKSEEITQNYLDERSNLEDTLVDEFDCFKV